MSDERQLERDRRSMQDPLVGGLPDFPGILAAMHLSPDLAQPLRALANSLLVSQWTGATISRAERELIATAVSAANDCIYCMDSHGAFARTLLTQAEGDLGEVDEIIESIKLGTTNRLSAKLQALLQISKVVRVRALDLTSSEVAAAKAAGASDGDVQLTILIAAAFSMYNRIVDGFRARTPRDACSFEARSIQIATFGYLDPRVVSVPGSR